MKIRVISRTPNGMTLGAPGYPNLYVRYVADRKQKSAAGGKLTNLARTLSITADVPAGSCKDSCATEVLSYRNVLSGSLQNATRVGTFKQVAETIANGLMATHDGFAPVEEVEVSDELIQNLFAKPV